MILYSTLSPEAKRKALRERLRQRRPLIMFGAFNALSARMIEKSGGEAVYLSGHLIAADLGLPDLGLTTITEVAQRSQQVARMIDVPLVVDADTGFGEPLNAARSIQTLEDAGVAGCHIEDQVNPKQCGHSEGIQVVGRDRALQRISAAVMGRRDSNFLIIARTDARAAISLEESITRARAFRDAGADVIFAEALRGPEEVEQFRRQVDGPIMVNLNEFSHQEPLNHQQIEDLGIDIAIYPMTLTRLAMGAVSAGITGILKEGTQSDFLSGMQTKDELYSLLQYEDYHGFDQDVFRAVAEIIPPRTDSGEGPQP